jgi:TM2 domain-containing membrane protein YozV
MDTKQMLASLPEIQMEELKLLQELVGNMTENQQQQFYILYQGKRKQQQHLMLMTLAGFFGIAGIQRFVVGETGLGIVYLLTVGFCGIGTIVDLVNLKSMTLEFNKKQAFESANMAKMLG